MSDAAILIVEDERILARDLELTLRRAGYRVSGLAANGEAALRSAGQLRPDLIIMDVILQGELDGFEVADRINLNLGIPVLFLSSFRDAGLLARAKQAEAVGYLLKPCAESDLLATIEVALHWWRSNQRRAQKVLAASECRFRRLFYASPQGIALVDQSGRILDANPALAKILDYEPPQMKNLVLPEVVHVDDRASEHSLLKELFAGERESYRVEQRNLSRSGRLLRVRTEAWLLSDEEASDGPPLALRTVEDISEPALLQERLAMAQRMEIVGRMAMGLAHNLGNELTPVLLGLPLLRLNIEREDRFQMLASMEMGLQRGANLIRQILRSGRNSNRERAVLDCAKMMEELAGMARQIFSGKIRVTTSIGRELWRVQANPDEIHQCLLNLCVNARDAMPEGGDLRLTVRNEMVEVAGSNFLPDARPGRYVLLSVSDTGVGVPPEILNRVCEPFFTTKPAGQGTGLGLSMTSEMIRNHGGYLRFRSQPGRGTEVGILLPADQAAVPAPGPVAAPGTTPDAGNCGIALRGCNLGG
jgi:PAS domain S-box-containing protein